MRQSHNSAANLGVATKSIAVDSNGRVSEAFAQSRQPTATTSGSRLGSTAIAGRAAHAPDQLPRLTASRERIKEGAKTRTLRRVMARKAVYPYVKRTEPPPRATPAKRRTLALWQRVQRATASEASVKQTTKKTSRGTVSLRPCSSLKQSQELVVPIRRCVKFGSGREVSSCSNSAPIGLRSSALTCMNLARFRSKKGVN